jgi:hypothetical protein
MNLNAENFVKYQINKIKKDPYYSESILSCLGSNTVRSYLKSNKFTKVNYKDLNLQKTLISSLDIFIENIPLYIFQYGGYIHKSFYLPKTFYDLNINEAEQKLILLKTETISNGIIFIYSKGEADVLVLFSDEIIQNLSFAHIPTIACANTPTLNNEKIFFGFKNSFLEQFQKIKSKNLQKFIIYNMDVFQ